MDTKNSKENYAARIRSLASAASSNNFLVVFVTSYACILAKHRGKGILRRGTGVRTVKRYDERKSDPLIVGK